jgi:hypothetical protein
LHLIVASSVNSQSASECSGSTQVRLPLDSLFSRFSHFFDSLDSLHYLLMPLGINFHLSCSHIFFPKGYDSSNYLRWVQVQFGNVSLYARFSEYAVIDDINNHVYTILDSTNQTQTQVAIVIPHFWTSMIYCYKFFIFTILLGAEIDPDFSILITGEAPSSSQVPCGDGQSMFFYFFWVLKLIYFL